MSLSSVSSVSSVLTHPRFLAGVMWADAVSCAGCGALQLGFTDAMARLTGLSTGLLAGTGWFLLTYALGAGAIASRATRPASMARALIAVVALGNVGWAVACAGLAIAGPFQLSLAGAAWLWLQAATVLVLADLQWTGLRRSRSPRAMVTA